MPLLPVFCLVLSCVGQATPSQVAKLSIQVSGGDRSQIAFLPRRSKMIVHCVVSGGGPKQGDCRVTLFRVGAHDVNTGNLFLSDYVNHAVIRGPEFDVNLRELIDHAQKKDFVERDLDVNGHVRLYLALSSIATGEQIAIAPVEIGEPVPKNLPTTLQVFARSLTEHRRAWAAEGPLLMDSEFRWSTSASTAARFVLQLSQTRFAGWEGWASTKYKTMDLHDRSHGLDDYKPFTARDLLQNPRPPAYEVGVYYLRVVPIDSEGNLAGLPSNVVRLVKKASPTGEAKTHSFLEPVSAF